MTLFFADLVREASWGTGTANLPLGGALPGHRSFADAVPPGARFHYAIAGVTHPQEWETGEGEIGSGGALVRLPLASSAGGGIVDFSAGLKTVALTVNAAWYAQREGGLVAIDEIAGLADALAGKADADHGHAFEDLDGRPTSLAGYGITDAQPLDADLTAIAELATAGYGRSFLTVGDAAAGRSHLGLGGLSVLNAVNDAQWSGADLSIANGGTGASTAAAARTNLGLGSAATFDTGTSGGSVPLLNGVNVWSAPQTVNADIHASGRVAAQQQVRGAGYNSSGLSGAGVDVGVSSGNGIVQAYNFTTPGYIPLVLSGSAVSLQHASSGVKLSTTTTGIVVDGVATFDRTAGAYCSWGIGGAIRGDVGIGSQVISGGSSNDVGITSRAAGNVVIGVNTTAVATFKSFGLEVSGTGQFGSPTIASMQAGAQIQAGTASGAAAGIGIRQDTVEGWVIGMTAGSSTLRFRASGTDLLTITNGGVIADRNGIELGYRSIPSVASSGGAATSRDICGKCYDTTAGLSLVSGAFQAGDIFSIYNNSASAITITQGAGLTLRLAGTATTGNRTLAARGFCTVRYLAANEAHVMGHGLS